MKFKSAVGAAILVTVIPVQESLAAGTQSAGQVELAGIAATEYGETLPPVGYVKFCHANASECAPYTLAERFISEAVAMSAERWDQVERVNAVINRKIKPVTDQALYGEPERWTYPVVAGDCEDYLLLKKRELEKLGFPAKALRITVVLQEHGEGHAVLTLTTTEGDYILDNRRNDILLWSDTNYTFLKRQSAQDPKRWVALLKAPVVGAEKPTAAKSP
jgi:predicted transglutaminase-like cysteine proteinase